MPPRPVLLNRTPGRFHTAVRQWPKRCRALVEGDSWFQYDARLPFVFGSNLFLSIHQYFRCVTLTMSSNGDTVQRMLGPGADFEQPERVPPDHPDGVANLRELEARLHRRKHMHVVFFSGGGNDVVDNLDHLLVPFEPGITADQALREPQVGALMFALRRGYEQLLRVRDEVSPDTLVLTHNYAVSNLHKGAFGRWGFRRGPWIKRAFAKKGYYADPSRPQTLAEHALMTEIVSELITRFGLTLLQLTLSPDSRFFLANTRALVGRADWRDEMHLTKAGYERAAEAFREPLRRQRSVCIA